MVGVVSTNCSISYGGITNRHIQSSIRVFRVLRGTSKCRDGENNARLEICNFTVYHKPGCVVGAGGCVEGGTVVAFEKTRHPSYSLKPLFLRRKLVVIELVTCT